nr:MAG TPA: hypothetical protein [Caudoviricetes sp.]
MNGWQVQDSHRRSEQVFHALNRSEKICEKPLKTDFSA